MNGARRSVGGASRSSRRVGAGGDPGCGHRFGVARARRRDGLHVGRRSSGSTGDRGSRRTRGQLDDASGWFRDGPLRHRGLPDRCGDRGGSRRLRRRANRHPVNRLCPRSPPPAARAAWSGGPGDDAPCSGASARAARCDRTRYRRRQLGDRCSWRNVERAPSRRRAAGAQVARAAAPASAERRAGAGGDAGGGAAAGGGVGEGGAGRPEEQAPTRVGSRGRRRRRRWRWRRRRDGRVGSSGKQRERVDVPVRRSGATRTPRWTCGVVVDGVVARARPSPTASPSATDVALASRPASRAGAA